MAGHVWGQIVSSARTLSRGRALPSYVDEIKGVRIRGWIWDPGRPGRRITVQVFSGADLIGAGVADRFRADLQAAGVGDGCHAFDVAIPPALLDGKEHLISVRAKSGPPLSQSPRLLKPSFQGVLDRPEGSILEGWAWNPYAPHEKLKVEILGNQTLLATIHASLYRADLEEAEVGDGRHAFRFELPPQLLDGRENEVRARIAGAGHELDGSPLIVKAEFESCLDDFSGEYILGWAWNRSSKSRPIALDIFVDNERIGTVSANRFRADLLAAGKGDGCIAFQIRLPARWRTRSGFVVSAKIAGSDVHLKDSPKLVLSSAVLRETVTAIHSKLNETWQRNAECSDSGALNPYACEYIRRALFPALVDALPATPFVSLALDQSKQPVSQNPFPATDFQRNPVDVIVPVHRGVEETLRCLKSLAAAPVLEPHEIIVLIDDPDPVLYRPVLALAKEHGFTVHTNARNGGFVSTANRGFRLHPDRDVVLLNSDTVVHGDWLGRLRVAAYSDLSIGTVTPLSNNATICSYPNIYAPGELPSPAELQQLDEICETHNRGEVVDLPSGVGFCLYIRRSCLIDTGLFDEALWSKGYGEENDLCLRASRNGWRNVAATDVFIGHDGNASFGAERNELIARNSGVLSRLYPKYDAQVAEFVKRDPLLPYRRRIDLTLLGPAARGGVLHVTADLDGGSSRHIQDLVRGLKTAGVVSLVLTTSEPNRASLSAAGRASLSNLVYDLERDFRELVAVLRECGIRHVHYHQRNSPAALELAAALGVPYDVTIHDYSWICPQVTLIDESLKYCGEPSIGVCEKCLKLNGSHPLLVRVCEDPEFTVGRLREESARFLAGARKVFCPNPDVRQRLSQYFALDNLTVKPHPETALERTPVPFAPAGETLRVAVLGAIGPHKGYDVLLSCARHALARRLPVEFVVIGYTSNDAQLQALDNVVITGRYKEADLPGLILRHKVSIAFFPSVCPETYAFTLSTAFAMALYPVAFQLGSIAERIRNTGYGSVIPLTHEPEVCIEALFAAANYAKTAMPPTNFVASYDNLLCDYYELSQDHYSTGAPAAVGNGELHLQAENGKH